MQQPIPVSLPVQEMLVKYVNTTVNWPELKIPPINLYNVPKLA